MLDRLVKPVPPELDGQLETDRARLHPTAAFSEATAMKKFVCWLTSG